MIMYGSAPSDVADTINLDHTELDLLRYQFAFSASDAQVDSVIKLIRMDRLRTITAMLASGGVDISGTGRMPLIATHPLVLQKYSARAIRKKKKQFLNAKVVWLFMLLYTAKVF